MEIEYHVKTEIKEEIESKNDNDTKDEYQGKADIKNEDDSMCMGDFCEVILEEQDGGSSTSHNNEILDLGEEPEEVSHECDECHQVFGTIKMLLWHQRSHKTNRPFVCMFCKKTFRQKGHLEEHLRSHTGQRPYTCIHCDRSFKQKSELNVHMRVHAGGALYKCHICDKTFQRHGPFNLHLQIHTGNKPYPCSFCSKTFTLRAHLANHLKTHLREGDLFNISTKHAQNEGDAVGLARGNVLNPATSSGVVHIMNGHLNGHPMPQNSENVFVGCNQCQTFHALMQSFISHLQTHASDPTLKCPICDKSFVQESHLRSHMKSHEAERQLSISDQPLTIDIPEEIPKGMSTTIRKVQIPEPQIKVEPRDEEEEEEIYKCTICVAQFSNQDEYFAHVEGHDKNKPYVCNYCHKGFKQKQSFQHHVLSHTGKNHICPYCHAMIENEDEYQAHVRTHTAGMPYICNFCRKGFKKKANLKMHLRTHTGEKPYVCHFCNKAFRLQPNLKCHLRVHTGEKPYVCNYCKKGFAQQTAWKSHIQLHTGKKYECSHCSMAFAVRAHLKNHTLKYHSNNNSTLTCQCCRIRFTSEEELYAHWQHNSVVNDSGKLGCGLYRVFESIIGRNIVNIMGVRNHNFAESLKDFLVVSGGKVNRHNTPKHLVSSTEALIKMLINHQNDEPSFSGLDKTKLQTLVVNMLRGLTTDK